MDAKNLLFQCPHCEFSTKHKGSLIRHKNNVHKEKKRGDKCKLCNYIAPQKYDLIRHIRTHTGERPFPCNEPGCNYAAKQLTDLIRHRRCVHVKLKTHSCNLCDYRTGQKYHLSRHMLTHRKNAEKLKFCDLCPYKTVLAENLRRHKITVHSKAHPFKCPHSNCDYAGKFEPYLKAHLLSHRTDDSWKPAKCPWPGCTFRGRIPAVVRRHITLHTKEKRFKCTLCPKGYTNHGALVSHMCTHTKEVHYPCKLCDYGAARISDLQKHYATYHPTTPRALKCPVNGCFFTADDGHRLNRHLSARHAIRGPNYMLQSTVKWREKVKERRRKKLEGKNDQNMPLNCRVPRCPIVTKGGAAMASHLYIVHDLPRVVVDRIGLKTI